jgi:hypothetical protein
MKLRMAALSILCLGLQGVALADAYSNGPILGTAQAFFVDEFAVTNSFQPNTDDVTSFSFGAWTAAGTIPTTVDWTVGISPFGSELASGIANAGIGLNSSLVCRSGEPFNGGICGAGLGYDVYSVTVSLGQSITTQPGFTYWLTLTHAVDQLGGMEGWDVNFGPSEAWMEVKWDPIPSESFAINPAPVPEPGSIAMFASVMFVAFKKLHVRAEV